MSYFLDELTKDKCLVLYFFAQSELELTNTQTVSVWLANNWAHYYNLQESLAQLAQNGLLAIIRRPAGECYCISESGRNTAAQFCNRLPQSLREIVDAYIAKNKARLMLAVQHLSRFDKLNENEYMVHCQIVEGNATLMALDINVVSREMAVAMTVAWEQHAQEFYAQAFHILSRSAQ